MSLALHLAVGGRVGTAAALALESTCTGCTSAHSFVIEQNQKVLSVDYHMDQHLLALTAPAYSHAG